jgi:hypothetical protein
MDVDMANCQAAVEDKENCQNIDMRSCQAAVKDIAAKLDRYGFRQPDELPADEKLWPIREDQMPEVVYTAEEFLDALLYQTHIDRIVVLPNGIELLRQEHGIPDRLVQAVRKSNTIRQFLDEITHEGSDIYRGRLWHYSVPGMEKEIKTDDKSKLLCDKVAALKKQEAAGVVAPNAPVYVSELRYTQKQFHPIAKDEYVKTATQFDIYDYTPLSRKMPLWERSEGGIFFGERGTGSGFHIDQCMWSNVGRNWCGFKLFAIWPWAERFNVVEEIGKGKMLHTPLNDKDMSFLSRAKRIVLARPGDIWVFSGAQPHTALVVGDGLNVSAYESFVPAHPEAVGTLVRSNIKDMHPRNFWMDDEDLDELFEDVVDNIQRVLKGPCMEQRLKQRLEECASTMRQRGDAYCKELWRQEDTGERRRRREDESSDYSSDGSDCEGGETATRRPAKLSRTTSNFTDGAATKSVSDENGPQCKMGTSRSASEPAVLVN